MRVEKIGDPVRDDRSAIERVRDAVGPPPGDLDPIVSAEERARTT